MTLVSPHAMYLLRPIATAGAPGSVAPITSKSPADRCARYHSDGICAPRCGSLASSGLPDAVIVPSTTQLLDPSASPVAGSGVAANASDHELSGVVLSRSPSIAGLKACTTSVFAVTAAFIHGMSRALRIVRPSAGYGRSNWADRAGP